MADGPRDGRFDEAAGRRAGGRWRRPLTASLAACALAAAGIAGVAGGPAVGQETVEPARTADAGGGSVLGSVRGAGRSIGQGLDGLGRRAGAALFGGRGTDGPGGLLDGSPDGGLARGVGGPGGDRLTVGVSTGLAASTNRDLDRDGDSSLTGDVRLDFSYLARTPIQSLRLSGDLGLRGVAGDEDDDDSTLSAPTLRFNYDRAVPSTRLTLTGFANRRDVDSSSPLSGFVFDGVGGFAPLDPDLDAGALDPDTLDPDLFDPTGREEGDVVLVDLDDEDEGDGTVTRFGLSGSLEVLRLSRVALTFSAGVSGERYSDDAAFGDEDRLRLGVGARFVLDRATTADLGLDWNRFEEDPSPNDPDGEDDDSYRLSAGVTRRLSGGGQIGLSSNVLFDDEGEQITLSASRTLRLPLWTITGRAGVTREREGDLAAVGGLDLSRELPNGRIGLSATRNVVTDEDDDTRELTALSLTYGTALTPRVTLSADAGATRVTDADGGDDETAGAVGVTLDRRLTERLTASLGARHRFEDEDGDMRRDTSVSLRLRRGFDFLR